jgi:uncharacterized protein CbrC (UPF0167 family)
MKRTAHNQRQTMRESLPSFKYHPDPIATGSFKAKDITCLSCKQIRSYVYVGPVYADSDLEKGICPWCIINGLAHEKFGAQFADINAIGDYDPTMSIPADIKREVAYRTPGFNGWQQERWLVHCGDACAFLGPAGRKELAAWGRQELIESLRADLSMSELDFRACLEQMNKQSGPTAYIFRCLHCGQYRGYSDYL